MRARLHAIVAILTAIVPLLVLSVAPPQSSTASDELAPTGTKRPIAVVTHRVTVTRQVTITVRPDSAVVTPTPTTPVVSAPPASTTKPVASKPAVSSSASPTTPTPVATLSPTHGGKRVIAYYPSWGSYRTRPYTPFDLPAGDLTHVKYAFANVDSTGRVTVGDPWIDVQKPHTYNGITLAGSFALLNDPRGPVRSKNPKLRSLISLGGWNGSKYFSLVARSATARATFAESTAAFLEQYGFDGVDIDWEYPVVQGNSGNERDPADGTNLTLMLEALRGALNRLATRKGRIASDPYLITFAASAAEDYYKLLDIPGLAKWCDWVNVMTYDASGPWLLRTAQHASIPFIKAAIDGYTRRGLPASKFALGIPYYARSFPNAELSAANPAQSGVRFTAAGPTIAPGTRDPGLVEWDDLVANYLGKGYVKYQDASAGTPVYVNLAARVWMSGEDEASVERKGRLASELGLAGVFAWDSSMDRSAVLTKAAKRGVESRK